jgi:putative NIF3 family GTP cyclohydrolase 1 type 2
MKYKAHDIIKSLPGIHLLTNDTVDTFLYGNPDIQVKGIAVTFLATLEQCKEAVQNNCNLIITHEGIWYSHKDQHLDTVPQSAFDPVYQGKHQFINMHNLCIYRYHDGIHRALPDMITAGLIKELHWTQHEISQKPAYSILELNMPLKTILQHIKQQLGISFIRYMGDLDRIIHKVIIAVGYRGSGQLILPVLAQEQIDAIIYGEGPEWEIPEYCRDALHLGQHRALIILGHGASESPGMRLLTHELQVQYKNVPVYYLPFKNQFMIG